MPALNYIEYSWKEKKKILACRVKIACVVRYSFTIGGNKGEQKKLVMLVVPSRSYTALLLVLCSRY